MSTYEYLYSQDEYYLSENEHFIDGPDKLFLSHLVYAKMSFKLFKGRSTSAIICGIDQSMFIISMTKAGQ